MKAYVICCEGHPEAVVIDDSELAYTKKDELIEEHYQTTKGVYANDSKETYLEIWRWHIKAVDVLK